MEEITGTTGLEGRHIVFFSWRDTTNPEGGGAERYLEKMAEGLVARGARVSVFCAAHRGAPSDEVRGGIRYVRRGSKMGVYGRGLLALLTRSFGEYDALVDVQNGLPFFTRAVSRQPVIVLVHHVHREQWPVVYPGRIGKVGWWIESRLAPRLYHRCQYVAVSRATREELVGLGVDADRISVVHNGTDPALPLADSKTPFPSVCSVGRLVPHKQVEHAIDAVLALRADHPNIELRVVGDGWWANELRTYAEAADAGRTVVFEGHVSEERKQEIYAESWLMALPSLKEGWGLVVGEAGRHGTPTVAYSSAGGTRESIEDGYSGLLVDAPHDGSVTERTAFTAAVRRVVEDAGFRRQLAQGAREIGRRFDWEHSQSSFAQVISEAITGTIVDEVDPPEQVHQGESSGL